MLVRVPWSPSTEKPHCFSGMINIVQGLSVCTEKSLPDSLEWSNKVLKENYASGIQGRDWRGLGTKNKHCVILGKVEKHLLLSFFCLLWKYEFLLQFYLVQWWRPQSQWGSEIPMRIPPVLRRNIHIYSLLNDTHFSFMKDIASSLHQTWKTGSANISICLGTTSNCSATVSIDALFKIRNTYFYWSYSRMIFFFISVKIKR